MAGLAWLTARPIAHRGLHDAGAVENTPSAFSAAIAAGYAIELDLQITADGEAVVHHDAELGRLTDGAGRLDALTAAELKRVPFKATADRIITLSELLDLVAGRATLLIELKSRYDGDRRLALRAAQVLGTYRGPSAVMSFDPLQMAVVRDAAPSLVRGLVAERHGGHGERLGLGERCRRSLAYLSNAWRSRPNFIAYSVADLPALPPWITRNLLGLPLLTWTVRTEDDRRKAVRWADQMIFEGWPVSETEFMTAGSAKPTRLKTILANLSNWSMPFAGWALRQWRARHGTNSVRSKHLVRRLILTVP